MWREFVYAACADNSHNRFAYSVVPFTIGSYDSLSACLNTGFALQVYRDDSRKGKNPPVKPAREFHLIWRQNGQSPVSMWEPLPPSGYRALGTVVVPAAEQPGSNEVLCVREDLCAKSGLFDSAIWKYEPTVMQVGNLLLQLLWLAANLACWAVHTLLGECRQQGSYSL